MKNRFYYAGIDVQISRGCAYYIIDGNSSFVDSGWVKESMHAKIPHELFKIIASKFEPDQIAVGIDAPRMPLKIKRKFSWNGKISAWIKNETASKGYGKHAEIIIKAAGIGNPQWTPILKDSPDWMKLGYSLFKEFSGFQTFEVFPSASYKLLENSDAEFQISLKNFAKGPKDMLDAAVAAFTVKQFTDGKGEAVGGGDGLGSIILPLKVSDSLDQNLLNYPI